MANHLSATDSTISKVYEKAIFNIFTGPRVNVRGYETMETLGHTVVLEDVRNNILISPVRNLNPRFMVAEWLWIMFGQTDVNTIAQYNSEIAKFSDDGKTFAGAYGPRIMNQLIYVEKCFKADKFTRQAVIDIWRPNPDRSRDIPCTLSAQFLYRDGRLNCIVTMRSSDAWLGLPYDMFNFSQLTNYVADYLGTDPGFLQMNLGSSHLYENNFESARDLLGSTMETEQSPQLIAKRLPYQLLRVLRNPRSATISLEIKEPWLTYARVLQSPNRRVAYQNLLINQRGGEIMPDDEKKQSDQPVDKKSTAVEDEPEEKEEEAEEEEQET